MDYATVLTSCKCVVSFCVRKEQLFKRKAQMILIVQLSIVQNGSMTWPQLRHFSSEVERLGFAGIYCDDHFPALNDAILKLGYLASHTQTLQLGTLVSPLSVRDPMMLARQGMAIDDLSGGRFTLGIGAGWMESEHVAFGYELGDVETRMARMTEGTAVIAKLIRSDEPINFEGRFYHLRDAQIEPRPQRHTLLMIGGNGLKRTLPLVAQFADVWNSQNATLEAYRECSAQLDVLLQQAGRRPGEVRRTIFKFIVCGRDNAEIHRYLDAVRRAFPGWFGPMSDDEILEVLRGRFKASVGTPEDIIAHLRAFADAGVEETMIAHFTPDTTECLELLASEVLPHVAGA